ncbi:AMP-binding protein [Kitasatospora sp. McL0602]|uniref:AMP-binding protein n=1 Tax=Kitasatospora sp. McL0602 TaxID=3439530 RepID=UPI003F8A7D2E
MLAVEQALRRYADSDRPLVRVLNPAGGAATVHGYREITRAAQRLAGTLAEGSRVGVVCANTPEFVVADLALLAARAVEIPVPLAFSAEQAAGLLEEADLLLVDAAGQARLDEWGQAAALAPGCRVVRVDLAELSAGATEPYRARETTEDWICKVIHTSGTTSRPKGVRIRALGIDALLASLHGAMPPAAFTSYLSTVPFSLLIEQVTGLYLVLLDGGSVTLLPPEAELIGTSATAVGAVLPHLRAARPTALVATPGLVTELAHAARAALAAGASVPETLFGTTQAPVLCCGGAPVHPDVLRELDELGVPVYEGYGLSENSSVVSWNTPGSRRIGTVGRPLPHVETRLGPDGELLVRSASLFAGYTRDDPSSCDLVDGWLHTGDLASIEDGFIRITGRKKNVIITSAGRNIAPEWVEAQYARLPFVQAVAVVGNQLPELHGLFVLAPDTDPEAARAAIAEFGAEHLSEVEQVRAVHLAEADSPAFRRYFTVTGRPVRAALELAITNHDLDTPPNESLHASLDGKEPDMPTQPIEEPYGKGAGRLLRPGAEGQTLADLDPAHVVGLLAEAGFLLLRGFAPSLEEFSAFVKAHSERVTLDPARSFHGGDVAQKVDAGVQALGLHIENGNSPFVPDLTWFLCEKAAAIGSQTTVCDGYRVWDRVADRARAAFTGQDVMYSRRVEEDKWKTFVLHQLGGAKPLAEITLADFLALITDQDSTTVEPAADGSVTYAYRAPAARTTLFGERLSWANSIFGPSYNYEPPRITFADGSEIPAELLTELAKLAEEETEDLAWQDGDVALIDNTRVMHGRRAITDPDRTIYNAQSYLKSGLR